MRKNYARWIARAVTNVRDIAAKDPALLASAEKSLEQTSGKPKADLDS